MAKKEFPFILISLFLVFLLTISYLNLKVYFEGNKETKVLSAEYEKPSEEEFWVNYLESNPNYFPGLIELAKIQIANSKYDRALQTLLKAKSIDPNSDIIEELEEEIK
ncbi:hypothetical protein A2W13_01285 [Candidatus Woesebacteria bacterium RBG_16_36_11]|uniref:Tetratricopeptide repeat-like domain-containing protein n=3 Tax=Candidatus Woeseibacteriota TaxID=1752722 RepID=A0A1F7XB59_9BACT|nr:MAG: hypothetical protein A2Z67_03290 [Candidatus Woesebacteria bacterium RBG_13_36_22]OGM12260.1 MAG: hypothetical protein A2W13_01285 [Candidatus Woesebacteria bacterium RBG_16_36_11]OGM16322.1 MAG: hypothetical protein A2V55_01230 [Candidatus Woesebacteria bacterium RBG_19FT_COMBO_37_29]